MVELSNSLGVQARRQIDTYMREQNIPIPEERKKIYNPNMMFLETELKYVTSLIYTGDPINLKLFPNLKNLTFDGNPQVDMKVLADVLLKFPELEELHIKNQKELTIIDLSRLRNLKVLEIISNSRLYKIEGIPDEIKCFTFFDNPLYRNPKQICEYLIRNIESATEFDLDMMYYIDLQNMLFENPSKYKYEDIMDLVSLYTKWSEKITDERKYLVTDWNREKSEKQLATYTTSEMNILFQKAMEIINLYTRPTDKPLEKFAILYYWMCSNVTYDQKGAENNHTSYIDSSKPGEKIITGKIGGTNGTYNGLMLKSAVCQGYTKAFQYLLKIIGIKSFDTLCITSDKSKLTEGAVADHSITKANLGGSCFYCDITWDAVRFQKQNNKLFYYFMMSIEDISKDHKLIGEDGVFSGDSMPLPEKIKLMEFASNRIREVNEQRMNHNPSEHISL